MMLGKQKLKDWTWTTGLWTMFDDMFCHFDTSPLWQTDRQTESWLQHKLHLHTVHHTVNI